MPSKYPLPPTTLLSYAAVGANGLKAWTEGVPLAVIIALFELASKNLFDWHVSRVVPEIAVNGEVGGVNADVYNAVPFTNL